MRCESADVVCQRQDDGINFLMELRWLKDKNTRRYAGMGIMMFSDFAVNEHISRIYQKIEYEK